MQKEHSEGECRYKCDGVRRGERMAMGGSLSRIHSLIACDMYQMDNFQMEQKGRS